MSELVDLVNDSGEVMYVAVPREEVDKYPDAMMQIVIVVIFNSRREVLIHERAATKSHGGEIDLVCGGIKSGQTPIQAGEAESGEETGVVPDDLKIIREGRNPYGRYCFLLLGHSDNPPMVDLDPREVAWVGYWPVDVLREKETSGEMTFVKGFFEDVEFAMNHDGMIEP